MQRFFIGATLIGYIFFSILLLPHNAMASGACYCVGKKNDCSVFSNVGKLIGGGRCLSYTTAEHKPFNSQSDCDTEMAYLNATSNSSCTGILEKCWYTESAVPNCTNSNNSAYDCGGTPCIQTPQKCSFQSDCTRFDPKGLCLLIDASANSVDQGTCYFNAETAIRIKNMPSVSTLLRSVELRAPSLSIGIPGVSFTKIQDTVDSDGYIHLPWIGEYIAGIYKFLLYAASFVAVFMIILSGARIAVSAGGEGQQAGYKRIGQVVVGLVILWGSYLILNTIDPNLTKFQALKILYIKPDPTPEESHDDALTQTLAQATADGFCVAQNTLDSTARIPHLKSQAQINKVSKNLIPLLTRAAATAADTTDPVTGKKFDGLILVSGVRTLTNQTLLFQKALTAANGNEEVARSHVGKPQGCAVGSNHLTGQAVDLHLQLNGVELKSTDMTEERINVFQDKIMTPTGWTRYCPEWWHFEAAANNDKPQRSTKCDRPYGTGNAKLKTNS